MVKAEDLEPGFDLFEAAETPPVVDDAQTRFVCFDLDLRGAGVH